jgi:hypothetical protein
VWKAANANIQKGNIFFTVVLSNIYPLKIRKQTHVSIDLHNIAILRKEPIVEEAEDDVLQDIQPQAEQYEGQQDDSAIREYFARNLFSWNQVYANVCKIINLSITIEV